MKISAVIPAYNSAKFIAAAIASIQAQSLAVDEIIVVDDGSTDNTEEVVANIAGSISYIKQTNQGPSSARNKGIELATGDWIAFLDADDQWTPEKISKQIKTLKNHPELRLIAGDMAEIDIDDKIITASVLAKHNLLKNFQQLAGSPIPDALAALVSKNFIPTGTVLVDRNAIVAAGLFSTEIRYGEDLEMWAKIAAKHPIACLPEILMLRRQHGANATQASERMLVDLIKVTDSIRRYAKNQLEALSVSPDGLVADAHWMLGYWHFTNSNRRKAFSSFASSLKQQFRLNTFVYLLSCWLPEPIKGVARFIKQKFVKFFY